MTAPNSHDNTPLPASIGNYVVEAKIDEGGFGEVFRVRHMELRDQVRVIKRPRNRLSARDRGTFIREVQTQINLRHPNIVQVRDCILDGEVPCIVMDYVHRGSLEAHYASKIPSPQEATSIVHQCCLAVREANGKGVYHLDLKPRNILMGDDGTPMVTDFGLALALHPGGDLPTGKHRIGGTKGYMAPEVRQREEIKNFATVDVFGLGGILFWLLTGSPPAQEGEQAQRQAEQRLRQATQNDPQLRAICLKALAEQPGERYASAADMATELEGLLATFASVPAKTNNTNTVRVLAVLAAIGGGGALAMLLFLSCFATIAFQAWKASRPKTWLEATAEERGINLDDVQAEDFEIECIYASKPNRFENYPGRIVVTTTDHLVNLLPGLEYRIGQSAWYQSELGPERNVRLCLVQHKDMVAGGTLFLRLDSEIGFDIGHVVGPFEYDVDVGAKLRQLVADHQRATYHVSPPRDPVDVAIEILEQRGGAPLARFDQGKLQLLKIARFAESIKRLEIGPTADRISRTMRFEFTDNYADWRDHEREFVGKDTIPITKHQQHGFIPVPPHWESVFIRIVFKGGEQVRVYQIENSDVVTGGELQCVSPVPEHVPKPEYHVFAGHQTIRGEQIPGMAQVVIPPRGYETISYVIGENRTELRDFSKPLDARLGYGEVTIVCHNESGDELGPFVFRLPCELVRRILFHSYEPKFRREKLLDAYHVNPHVAKALLEGSVHVAGFEKFPNVRTVLDDDTALNRERATVTLIGHYADLPQWAPVRSVSFGWRRNQLNHKITVEVPWHITTREPNLLDQNPIFAEQIDGIGEQLFASFTFVDGTTSEPFEVPLTRFTILPTGQLHLMKSSD